MARLNSGAAVLLALAACGPSGAGPRTAPPIAGASGAAPGATLLLAGAPRALLASADGAWLAALTGCRPATGSFLPAGTATCDLRVVPGTGGPDRLVARGVTTLPQGAFFAPEGSALAALADFDHASGTGTLVLVVGGEAREVARGVTFDAFVPGGGGALLAVADGRLLAVAADGAARPVPGADRVASFDLPRVPGAGVPGGLARRPARSGGELLLLDRGFTSAKGVAGRTVDYGFAPAGPGWAFSRSRPGGAELWLGAGDAARLLAPAVRRFALGPGGEVAWIAEPAPGEEGDLLVAGERGTPVLLGRSVGEFRWARTAPRLAWLERYDPRSRSGVLGAGGRGTAPRAFGAGVTDLELTADGQRLAFLRHTAEGGFSVDLWLADLAGPAVAPAHRVARGVFGFAFSPDGRWLLYRTRCTRNGDACDLERVASTGQAPPSLLATGVKSFDFDPRDPGRLLLGWQRADLPALDIAIWRGGRLAAVDEAVLPGSAGFLGPDSAKVAYARVRSPGAGVVVAPVPAPVR